MENITHIINLINTSITQHMVTEIVIKDKCECRLNNPNYNLPVGRRNNKGFSKGYIFQK